MINVVIDTNLIISAYYNKHSASAIILEAVREGKVNVLWSESILNEVRHVLDRVRADDKFRSTLLSLFKQDHMVTHTERIAVVEDDPQDDKFLGCALKGASYVITNDHHLLEVGEYRGVKMIRPRDFVRELKL